jgi:hypothetical protein
LNKNWSINIWEKIFDWIVFACLDGCNRRFILFFPCLLTLAYLHSFKYS